LEAGVAAHDLCGAAGGGEEFDGPAQVPEDADEGGHGGRLSRAGVSADDEAASLLGAHKEAAEGMEQRLLARRGGVRKAGPQAIFYFFGGGGAGHGGIRGVDKGAPDMGKVRTSRVTIRPQRESPGTGPGLSKRG